MLSKISFDENTMTVNFVGDIDHHSSRQIRGEVDKLILEKMPKHLIFDFKEVSFMDSSGIGLIMGRYKLINEYGGGLELLNVSPYLKKVMKIAGLESIVKISNAEQITTSQSEGLN